MTTKKIILIATGTVFGLLLLGFLTIVTIGIVNRSVNGAKVNGNVITSAHFEVTVPEGSKLTNKDETNNSIYVTTPTEYGELRISLNRSSWDVTQLSERGKITTEDITVDGTPAILKLVDYSDTISGKSEKPLIRYRLEIDKINKPSNEEYSTVEVTAMSKRNLTNAEEKDVQEKARTLINSIKIK